MYRRFCKIGGGGKVSTVAQLAYSKNDALQNSATQ